MKLNYFNFILKFFPTSLAVFPFGLVTTKAREGQVIWKVVSHCNSYFKKSFYDLLFL